MRHQNGRITSGSPTKGSTTLSRALSAPLFFLLILLLLDNRESCIQPTPTTSDTNNQRCRNHHHHHHHQYQQQQPQQQQKQSSSPTATATATAAGLSTTKRDRTSPSHRARREPALPPRSPRRTPRTPPGTRRPPILSLKPPRRMPGGGCGGVGGGARGEQFNHLVRVWRAGAGTKASGRNIIPPPSSPSLISPTHR